MKVREEQARLEAEFADMKNRLERQYQADKLRDLEVIEGVKREKLMAEDGSFATE